MKYLPILLLFLTSCDFSPEVKTPTPSLLFEHDGCKIYRFRDDTGANAYYSDCRPPKEPSHEEKPSECLNKVKKLPKSKRDEGVNKCADRVGTTPAEGYKRCLGRHVDGFACATEYQKRTGTYVE